MRVAIILSRQLLTLPYVNYTRHLSHVFGVSNLQLHVDSALFTSATLQLVVKMYGKSYYSTIFELLDFYEKVG